MSMGKLLPFRPKSKMLHCKVCDMTAPEIEPVPDDGYELLCVICFMWATATVAALRIEKGLV